MAAAQKARGGPNGTGCSSQPHGPMLVMVVDFGRITRGIIESIEEGVTDYRMPWVRSGASIQMPVNALTRRPYRGINILLLWATAERSRLRDRPLGNVPAVALNWSPGSPEREGDLRSSLEAR